MPETLLSPSRVILYGREVEDLMFRPTSPPGSAYPESLGDNNFLRRQLASGDPRLARIYAFSFEGSYYELTRPVIFLVHGQGRPAEDAPGGVGSPPRIGSPPRRAGNESRGPSDVDRTGVAAQEYSFASDMDYWTYDKGDFSIRLDVETGPFDQILLDAELLADGDFVSGANVRGANVRGANVRGANVRGANVRGANGRGANVRGANVRGGSD